MIDTLEDTCCLYLCLDTFHKTRFLCPFHQDYMCSPFPLNLCMSFSFSNISMLTKSYDKWLENDDKRRDVGDNMLEMPKKKKTPWKEDDAKDVDLMLWYYMQYVKEDLPLSPPLLPLLSTLQPSELKEQIYPHPLCAPLQVSTTSKIVSKIACKLLTHYKFLWLWTCNQQVSSPQMERSSLKCVVLYWKATSDSETWMCSIMPIWKACHLC